MKDNWISDVCWLNTAFLKGNIRGAVVYFHGQGGGIHPDSASSPVEIALGEAGFLLVYPYYGPWAWMNRQARVFTDELIDRIYREFELDDSLPLISMGQSMGGCASLLYCISGKRRPVGCCAIFPVCDTVHRFSQRNPATAAAMRHAFAGYPEPFESVLIEHSPLHQAEKMPRIPYLFIHGEADKDVDPIANSQCMTDKLKSLGHDVEYISVPQMGHGTCVPLRILNRQVDFVEKFAKK